MLLKRTIKVLEMLDKMPDDQLVMGNVDPVKYVMLGTPEQVTQKSYEVIEAAGREGGLILAPGCETPISSPFENVLAMGRAGREYWTR